MCVEFLTMQDAREYVYNGARMCGVEARDTVLYQEHAVMYIVIKVKLNNASIGCRGINYKSYPPSLQNNCMKGNVEVYRTSFVDF